MQKDMHYYGTYAIARAAGLQPQDARVIAYSAQFVDDSTMDDSLMHEDGGLLYGVATAHHPTQAGTQYLRYRIKNFFNKIINGNRIANLNQRRMWIPFHFYPGNEGDTLSEKLICRKNSFLVNEMFDNHIQQTKENPYILQLIGIASHVYMDTFSHYGFSGMSSRNNKIKSDSFQFNNMQENMNEKLNEFSKKYRKDIITKNWRDNKSWVSKVCNKFKSDVAEIGSGALGHGSVATFPDQPYLEWKFQYEEKSETSERNNPQTYLEGCENLYLKLRKFSDLYYSSGKSNHSDFSHIKDSVKEILYFRRNKKSRIKKWIEYIRNNKLFGADKTEFLDYDPNEWENQKIKEFQNLKSSSEVIKLPVYRFHQSADYHRHYTLKYLLPKYGIIIN